MPGISSTQMSSSLGIPVKLASTVYYPISMAHRQEERNHFYYYYVVVESARLGGQLRIVHQAYVGMATRSPPSSRTALSLLSPPRRATSGCRALYGSEQSKPACLAYWRRSGPNPNPALRAGVPEGLSGSAPGLSSGNRSPDCSRCRVRRRPSARSWWTRIAQHSIHAGPSGRGHSYLRAEGHRAL